MFQPNVTYHNTQSLVLPQQSFGKKTLNNAYNTIAGLMAWRDAKKQAEKQEEALKKQEEWRDKIFKEWQARNGVENNEIDPIQQINNYETAQELEDLDLDEEEFVPNIGNGMTPLGYATAYNNYMNSLKNQRRGY